MASHSRRSAPPAILTRLPALRLGLGVDEIGEPFGLGQVHLPVQECPPGELARLREPQSRRAGERPGQRRRDRPPAGHMDLGDLLAGEAPRRREPDHQRAVERLAGRRVFQGPQDGGPVREHGPGRERLEGLSAARPGDAEDRDGGFPDAARLGEDRVGLVGEHVLAPASSRTQAAEPAAISRAGCRRRIGRRSPRDRPASPAGSRDSRCSARLSGS